MQPNKTLAAQFANELRQFFPKNAVEYFVSYYDYYQPEAYVPQTDTYIEKDSSLNEEVERLRHSATNSLLTRRDVIVVATVSAIYGLGTPQEYVARMVKLRVGDEIERDALLRRLVGIQYARNDLSGSRGTFRVRGDTLEVFPMYEELAVRIEFFGDEVEKLSTLHPLTGEVVTEDEEVYLFPASHYVAGPGSDGAGHRGHRGGAGGAARRTGAAAEVAGGAAAADADQLRHRDDAPDRHVLRDRELLPTHRRPRAGHLRPIVCSTTSRRTSCSSSTSLTSPCRRSAGCTRGTCPASGPWSTTASGCRAPWTTARCASRSSPNGSGRPSTSRRRPATTSWPSRAGFVEQLIRPTGLVDPEVIIKPTSGQIDDLMSEIRLRAERDERVLVTTLTKKMAEDLTDYLLENQIRTRYLHSEVDTLQRITLLRELRQGVFDVLVGINLLREGLDLPEVSLVAILDADKEGFLRSAKSLIQTIGRAARNVSGQVHMYADKITDSMAAAIDETNRRREKQVAYNQANGIDPKPLLRRSPTSPTCSPGRTPTPRSCSPAATGAGRRPRMVPALGPRGRGQCPQAGRHPGR